jgi:glucosamine--fructose-6-phosphate aminotransferase (isomerizing)
MANDRGVKTQKEILSQFATWETTLSDIFSQEARLREFFQRKAFTEIIFTGCGSTYYLSLAAAATFQALTGIRARAVPASELFLFPVSFLVKDGPVLLVAISRSGETTETLQAVQSFKKGYGNDVLAISCYEDSSLVVACSNSLVAKEAKEASVVQTRSFSSMLLIAQLCAGIAAGRDDYCNQLRTLPAHGERVIGEQHSLIKELGENEEFDKFVFLGSGPNYGLACEAMLKMKEMSLSSSEAFHFLEFRHGPKSAVSEKTLVVGLLSDSARHHEIAMVEEVRAIGAKTLVLTDQGGEEADYLVRLNSGLSELARGVLHMPLLQLLAYYRSLSRGLDPDAPPHLNAVVRLG